MRKFFHIIYLSLIAVFVGLIFYKINQLGNKVESDKNKAIVSAKHELNKAVKVFNDRLQTMMDITEDLADKITNNELDSLQLHQELIKVLKNNKDIFGFGVGYEPNEFSPTRELFAPFYIRPKDSIQLKLLEDSYNYTEKGWYTKPLNEGKAWFEPPYIGVVSQKLMAEYSVPFYKTDENGKKKAIGIVYLDYTIEDLTKAVKALDLGKSGYGIVASTSGLLISHPISEYVKTEKKISDLAKIWKNDKINDLFSPKPKHKYLDVSNPENGKLYQMFVQDIKTTGWKMGAVFVEDAFKTDYEYINQRNVEIAVFALMAVFTLGIYLIHWQQKSRKVIYLTIAVYSFCMFALITYVWLMKINKPLNIFTEKDSFPITENTSLQKFIDDQDSLRQYNKEAELLKIPTGVFLKHVEFDGSHNIKLSGIVWQKYPKELSPEALPPKLFFLETAPDAEALNYEKIYTKEKGDYIVHGWYFRLEIREQLSYKQYPFDWETISLRLGYPDLSKEVLFVPDLAAYNSINPQQLPGLSQKVVLPDWEHKGTYFDFKFNHYNTNFGVWKDFENDHKPDLYYNLVLKRKFFWPFMTNFIPLFTIAFLLFLAVTSFTSGDYVKKKIGFTGFGVLELCTAFLFVAILTHIDLRSSVYVNYVIYMDYFYFHIYLIILLYSVNAMLFTKADAKIFLLRYRDNFIPKLLYWPLLLTSLFIFTAIIFY